MKTYTHGQDLEGDFLNPHQGTDMLIDFRERGREGEREGEKHCLVASHICPNWRPNPQPFSVQDNAPTNWATLARGERVFLHWSAYIFKNTLFTFRGREKERERNIDWLPLTCPQLGTLPTMQVCSLTGNWTGDLWVKRPVLYLPPSLKISK